MMYNGFLEKVVEHQRNLGEAVGLVFWHALQHHPQGQPDWRTIWSRKALQPRTSNSHGEHAVVGPPKEDSSSESLRAL